MYRILSNKDLSNSNKIQLRQEIEGIYTLYLFTMSNTLYNITNERNMIYTSLGNIQIPIGNYSYNDLANTIQNLLKVLDINFSTVYNLNTGLYTISNTISFDLQFSNTFHSAANILGFTDTDKTGLTLTGDFVSNLNTDPIFFIRINEDQRRMFRNEQHQDYSFLISDKANFQEIIRVDNKNNPTQKISLKLTRSLEIDFLNTDGNILDFSNNKWTLILKRCDNPHAKPTPMTTENEWSINTPF